MTAFNILDDLPRIVGDVRGKIALVREDLNVPMTDGRVSADTRLRATVPTLAALSDMGCITLILAHFGRPKGKVDPAMSLAPIAAPLAEVLGRQVTFMAEPSRDALAALPAGSIVIAENSRFYAGEEANDPALAQSWAAWGDFYVNDAFSAAHRAHVTTEGLAHILPAFAGRSREAELRALDAALGSPKHPVAAVVGGAKVSSKIDVLVHLSSRVDHLIIGGGMANTFLAARGVNVGKSLCEHDLLATVETIFAAAEAANCTVHLPYDVMVSREFAPNPPSLRSCNVHEVAADEMILDVAPASVEMLGDVLKNCATLVWNGPMGAFETPPFDAATVTLAKMAAALTREGSLVSVAGGGDTVAALHHAGVAGDFSFVSTAGGAFLEWMEGRELPGVVALTRAKM